MFTIELKVPSNNKQPPCDIIDQENLDQIIDSCRENVLNPYLCSKIKIELLRFGFEETTSISLLELELSSTFHNNVIREKPDRVYMSTSIKESVQFPIVSFISDTQLFSLLDTVYLPS